VYDGNAPSTHIEATDTFPASNLTRRSAEFLIPVNELEPGDQMIISLYRMGIDDSYNHNIVITNVQIIGHFWRG